MRMTLYGMLQVNPNLFDGITLPEGLDVNILKNRILDHSGDLYPYIQVPERVQVSIGNWFEGMYRNFYMMFRALNDQYAPTENTDWTSETERHADRSGEDNTSNTVESKPNSSVTTSNRTNAFNSGTGTPRSETITSNSGKDTTDSSGKNTYEHGEDETFRERRHGNIGVMTTAQIIEAELQMRKFNIYDEIVKLFEKEFIVQVY